MSKWLIAGVVVSILGNLYLGFGVSNHLQLIEELQNEQTTSGDDLDDVHESLDDQQAAISRLENKPGVNIEALARTLATLTTDVDGIDSDIDNLSFRVDDIEYQLDRPIGCFAGDPVFWASGFSGGLTC